MARCHDDWSIIRRRGLCWKKTKGSWILSDPLILPVQTISILKMSNQRIRFKTRRYCAAEGCRANTRKRDRYGYSFPSQLVISPFTAGIISRFCCSAPRQVPTILPNRPYDLNYIKHPFRFCYFVRIRNVIRHV